MPATLVMVATLLVVYIVKSGPALAAYALTVTLLVPLTAWLVAAAGNVDDAAHQQLLAAASSRPAVHASRAVVGALFAAPLAVAATAWPLATGFVEPLPGRVGWLRTLGLGVVAHLVGVLVGVAVGTLVHRPLVARTGAAVVLGAGGSMAAVLVLVPFLRALAHGRPGVLAWWLPLSFAAAVGAVAAAGIVAGRSV